MISMHGNHPDVIEFINSKQDLTKVTGANISVQFTDEFMKAVENDSEFILRWPVDTKVEDIPGVENLPMNEKVWLNDSRLCVKRMKSRDIWNTFIHCSWNTGEPGMLFVDRHHDYSPDSVYADYQGVTTNPCGTISQFCLT